MTNEEWLIYGHALNAHKRFACNKLFSAIDQQEGGAVWDTPHDLMDVNVLGRFAVVVAIVHFFSSPPGRLMAMRDSKAVSLIQRTMGRAGWPPQLSPAGMSFMTPDPAAIRTPDPMVT
jgi:hypothetical protein